MPLCVWSQGSSAPALVLGMPGCRGTSCPDSAGPGPALRRDVLGNRKLLLEARPLWGWEPPAPSWPCCCGLLGGVAVSLTPISVPDRPITVSVAVWCHESQVRGQGCGQCCAPLPFSLGSGLTVFAQICECATRGAAHSWRLLCTAAAQQVLAMPSPMSCTQPSP